MTLGIWASFFMVLEYYKSICQWIPKIHAKLDGAVKCGEILCFRKLSV